MHKARQLFRIFKTPLNALRLQKAVANIWYKAAFVRLRRHVNVVFLIGEALSHMIKAVSGNHQQAKFRSLARWKYSREPSRRAQTTLTPSKLLLTPRPNSYLSPGSTSRSTASTLSSLRARFSDFIANQSQFKAAVTLEKILGKEARFRQGACFR